jgi:hypothetical protein
MFVEYKIDLLVEKKLVRRLYLDFGDSGVEYFNRKMKLSSLNSLNDIDKEVQLSFIYGLCEELYGDILKKDHFNKHILTIFLSLYDWLDVYSFIFWKHFFKGTPPINFIYYFFGLDIGKSLNLIHEKKYHKKNLIFFNDIDQFEFVSSLINDLTKDNFFIRKSIFSNFTRYLIYGENKSLKLKSFMNINKNSDNNILLSEINDYVTSNINLDNKNILMKSFEVLDSLKTSSNTRNPTININQKQLKHIDEDQIIYMLGRYLDRQEADMIVYKAKKALAISNFNLCSDNIKKEFVSYIIHRSEIVNYSKQKQKMIKTLLFMLLKM